MLLFLYTTMNHMLQYAHYELLFPTNLSAPEFQIIGSIPLLELIGDVYGMDQYPK